MVKEKVCGKCSETKSLNEFYKNKTTKDGYQYNCKDCFRAYDQNYAQSGRGKKARRKAVRRYARTDKRKQSIKRYQQSNKGKQTTRRYQQSRKGRQAAKKVDAIRRARKNQVGGDYTTGQWYALCKFYDFCCLRCNRKFPFEKLTLDHIRPVSKGGSSNIWNTQPLCNRCNSKKWTNQIDYRKVLPDWINRDGPVWQQDTLF